MNRISVNSLSGGAVLAAITAVLALGSAYVPLAGGLFTLVVAVPVIISVVRYGLRTGIMSALTAVLILSFFTGPFYGIVFMLQFMTVALVYGEMFRKKRKPWKILLTGTFTATLAVILIFILSFAVSGISIEEQMNSLMGTPEEITAMYEETGLLDSMEENGLDREDFAAQVQMNYELMQKVIPALLVMSGVFSAAVHYFMAVVIMRRLNMEVDRLPPFSHWKLPWQYIWIFIVGWGALLAGEYMENPVVEQVGQNIIMAFGMFIFVFGLSVLAYYLKKLNITGASRLFLIPLVLFFGHVIALTALAVGTIDLVVDFRKIGETA